MTLTPWQLIKHILWVITGGERRALLREMRALTKRTNEILARSSRVVRP